MEDKEEDAGPGTSDPPDLAGPSSRGTSGRLVWLNLNPDSKITRQMGCHCVIAAAIY